MRLLLRLNLFYGILAVLIWGGYQLVPDLHRYLPLGVVETLFNQESIVTLAASSFMPQM